MNKIRQANQFLQQGNISQAEQLYRELLKVNPNDIDALWGLGRVALALDSYQASYDIFKRCVTLVRQVPQLWLSLAQSCELLRRDKEAEQAILQAIKLNASNLPALQAMAAFYCQSNQLEKANYYLDAILALEPQNPQAFALKVRIKSQNKIDTNAQPILDTLINNTDKLNLQAQITLHYAFAQLFHQSGEVSDAFFHFQHANQKQSTLINFSVADMQPYFSCLTQVFSSEFIASIEKSTLPSKSKLTPIFIVGQPRTGSTLLEQMLAAHSDISTAGELPFLAGDIAQGIAQLTGQEFPLGCQKLTPQQCASLGQHYLANMQTIVPKAQFIIDKMPANYQSIGLIKMLLPNAKIIHITRDPQDVSWSIYRNYFAANEPYFCSLAEIIQYHHNYRQVMSHWGEVLPEFVHHLTYDALVSEPEETISSVLEFCGLDYQPDCLAFNKQQGYIGTLSDRQLRHGIELNRTKEWHSYREFLPDIFFTLK